MVFDYKVLSAGCALGSMMRSTGSHIFSILKINFGRNSFSFRLVYTIEKLLLTIEKISEQL